MLDRQVLGREAVVAIWIRPISLNLTRKTEEVHETYHSGQPVTCHESKWMPRNSKCTSLPLHRKYNCREGTKNNYKNPQGQKYLGESQTRKLMDYNGPLLLLLRNWKTTVC
jgi:hypothetical protein